MSENVPTPEEGELAEAIGRELDPRAFDRGRFYTDMDFGFYKSRHMHQIDKAVSSDAFRDWLAARDRENRAIGWDEGWVNRASRSLFGPVSVPEPPRGLNPYRGDNQPTKPGPEETR